MLRKVRAFGRFAPTGIDRKDDMMAEHSGGTQMTRPTVTTYNLRAPNGRHIRMATQVTFPDGHVVRFTERIPGKAEAVRQARIALTRRLIDRAEEAHK
jgi:hypothetical protein